MTPSPAPKPPADAGGRTQAGGDPYDWFARPGFIVFTAALMGLLSLAIELCVPALGLIAGDFGLENANAAQSVITLFILSFGVGHLFQGFLADRFGRKPVLLVNLAVYGAAGAACAATASFETLLIARAVQGMAAAGCRVVATAMLRDVKDGADLARSMSVAMMIFTGIPIVAPFVGQAIAVLVDYRAVFVLLSLAPALLFAIAVIRLRETWPAKSRVPIRPKVILRSLSRLFRTHDTLVYAAVGGVLYGLMFGFIASAPQIFATVYGVPSLLPVFLSMTAAAICLAAFLNSRIVQTLGPRRVVFIALCINLLASLALWIGARLALLDLPTFQTLVVVVMFGNGMAFSNCNVLAILPHGQIAGIASSVVGGAVMILSAVLSHFIGQSFDGTIGPLAAAFLGLSALVLVVERTADAVYGR